MDSGFRLAKQTAGPWGAAPSESRLLGADGSFYTDHQHPVGLLTHLCGSTIVFNMICVFLFI